MGSGALAQGLAQQLQQHVQANLAVLGNISLLHRLALALFVLPEPAALSTDNCTSSFYIHAQA